MRSQSGRTGTYLSSGPWAQIVAVDAICPDGKVRKIRVGTPDTMFSCPGRTRVAGINVSGNVFMQSQVSEHFPGEWIFTPVVYGGMAERHAQLVAKLAPLGIHPNEPATWPRESGPWQCPNCGRDYELEENQTFGDPRRDGGLRCSSDDCPSMEERAAALRHTVTSGG